MKKCVKMREMLFKNWKWFFENTNQTPPMVFKLISFTISPEGKKKKNQLLGWQIVMWESVKAVNLIVVKNVVRNITFYLSYFIAISNLFIIQ